MPIRRHGSPIPLALLLAISTGMASAPASAQPPDSAVVADARAFIEAYAQELRVGDRAAVAARYDRRGAYIVFDGDRHFMPWEAVRELYATQWTAPAAFEFRDLVYEPAGADAVVVNGDFYWTDAAGEAPMRFSYTALLLRQDGQLRIRLEDEARYPGTLSPR